MNEIIIFYHTFYEELLKNSIRHNIRHVTWVPTDSSCDATDYIKNNLPPFTASNPTICFMLPSFHTQTTILQLLSTLNIHACQILDLYQLYMSKVSLLHYERIIGNCCEPLDGMVFGISHGQTGIMEELLPGNVLNFCSSSQDIYFNTKVLSSLVEEYYDFVSSARYVIFDLFDYTYFNYDVLLSNECLGYLAYNGFFCEERNSSAKKPDTDAINQLLAERYAAHSNASAMAEFQSLFPDISCPDIAAYQTEYKNWYCKETVLSDSSVKQYLSPSAPVFSSIQRHIFEPTIQFQVANFDHFCKLLCRINPDVKIIGLLLPKYYVVEETEKAVNQIWKPYFESIISSFQQKYANFSFYDFKNLSEISQNQNYYQDLSHLNRIGACRMTEIISELVSE